MSPTDAILILSSLLSGSGGGGGGTGSGVGGSTTTGSGAGSGAGGGACVAHPSSSDAASSDAMRARSVTEADAQYVDLRRAQAAAQHIEFIEVISRTNVDAMVVAVVDLDALDV